MSKEQRDCYDKIHIIVAVVGLASIIAYTWYAAVQSHQMTKATVASVASVRAWVIPTDIEPPSVQEIKLGGQMPIYFKNLGKTPAFDSRLSEEFKYWDRETEKDMPIFGKCPPRKIVYAYGPLAADQGQWLRPPAIDIQLNPDQSAKLVAQKSAILVHACMGYRTILNNEEVTTDYCGVAYGADPHATAPCLPTAIKVW
jgi:hypothetical protein